MNSKFPPRFPGCSKPYFAVTSQQSNSGLFLSSKIELETTVQSWFPVRLHVWVQWQTRVCCRMERTGAWAEKREWGKRIYKIEAHLCNAKLWFVLHVGKVHLSPSHELYQRRKQYQDWHFSKMLGTGLHSLIQVKFQTVLLLSFFLKNYTFMLFPKHLTCGVFLNSIYNFCRLGKKCLLYQVVCSSPCGGPCTNCWTDYGHPKTTKCLVTTSVVVWGWFVLKDANWWLRTENCFLSLEI